MLGEVEGLEKPQGKGDGYIGPMGKRHCILPSLVLVDIDTSINNFVTTPAVRLTCIACFLPISQSILHRFS